MWLPETYFHIPIKMHPNKTTRFVYIAETLEQKVWNMAVKDVVMPCGMGYVTPHAVKSEFQFSVYGQKTDKKV